MSNSRVRLVRHDPAAGEDGIPDFGGRSLLALELVLVVMVAGLVVGTRFRVLAMAPLALAACGCAFLEALTIGASSGRAALHVAEAGVVFEAAYAFGAMLVHGRLPFLPARSQV